MSWNKKDVDNPPGNFKIPNNKNPNKFQTSNYKSLKIDIEIWLLSVFCGLIIGISHIKK